MIDSSCPCGASADYAACCGRYIDGADHAPTAEALMRSRYSAYARGAVDYLVKTHHPATREPDLRDQVSRWAGTATFTGLDVTDTGGGPEPGWASVTFTAHFTEDGERRAVAEQSRFEQLGSRWYYHSGEPPAVQTVRRATPKVGRNDKCPCGSGKKYKRCCGR